MHMASLDELRQVRLDKINTLEQNGMDPYPVEITRTHTCKQLQDDFDRLQDTDLVVAGRVMAVRGSGSIAFVVVHDGTSEYQMVLKKDELGESMMVLFTDTVDVGDFVQFTGQLFVTKKGHPSLLVSTWQMAGKSLLPLPDKYKGLQDQDEMYRKRYLDIISNTETFERFKTRSKIVSAIRRYLDDRDFMEIETPVLQNQAGGAMAQTFNTHHNDLDIPMVLRISLELEHKMIMAGGYPRIYEIGKNFRNEGSDPTHIQEFTMIEWYAAYETLEQNMDRTEELLKHLAQDIVGSDTYIVLDKDGSEKEV